MSENTTLNEILETRSNDELRELIALAQSILAQRETGEVAQDNRRLVKIDGVRVAQSQNGEYALVTTPYNDDFIKAARRFNGTWQAGNRMWRFDIRDMEAVRQLVIEHFGTDGSAPVEVCDVEMVLIGSQTRGNSRFALGREIVARPARDARVKLGDNVIIASGKFSCSGGSRANPSVMGYGEEPVTVLVRDVPVTLAQAAVESDSDTYRIV